MHTNTRIWSALLHTRGYVCNACVHKSRHPGGVVAVALTVAGAIAVAPLRRPLRTAAWTRHVSPCWTRQASTHDPVLKADTRHSALRGGHGSAGTTRLPHRHLVSLTGTDAAKFLQGLITNNVDPNSTASFYAAFLDARGRVLWDVFVYVRADRVRDAAQWECYIEVDESEKESLKKHLKRHKLRSKVQIEDVEDLNVWAEWGSDDTAPAADGYTVLIQDPRAPLGALSRGLKPGEETRANSHVPASGSTVEDYHRKRYEYGIAEGPLEITRGAALPMECNIDLSSGIDFKKGCYVGQELTIRTKHTGIVRKRILPVQFEAQRAPENSPSLESQGPSMPLPNPGTDIKQLDEQGNVKKGRAAGKFVAGVDTVGLALCRLEMMTSIRVSAEGGSWKPGAQFGCETETGIVKVKPIVHDWMLLREQNLWDKNKTRI